MKNILIGASPNPDYEQPISSCGDNVNLFDKDNANILNANIGNGVIGASNNAKTLYISCKANTTYTVSRKAGQRFQVGCSTNLPAIDGQVDNVTSNPTGSQITITTNSTAQYLVVYYYLVGTDTLTETEIRNSIKIEQGSIATPYSPYNEGVITEKVVNKNLINMSYYQQGSIDGTTGQNVANVQNGRGNDFIIVKPNTTYTISANKSLSAIRLSEYDINKNHIQRNQSLTSNKLTITTTANTFFVRWSFNYDGTTEVTEQIANSLQLQLEQGSTATDYVEHQEQNYSIYTQQPFRSIGTTRDVFVKKSDGKWYERHNIKELILNGTENWASDSARYRFYISVLQPQLSTNRNSMCNYFKSGVTENTNNCYNFGSAQVFFRIDETYTLSTFKNWLATQYANGTPVYADYVLTTPTDTLCTEEQTTQLEAYIKARTYNNVTHIYSEDVVSPVVNLEYVQDLRTLLNS